VADFNGDGKPDLAVANNADNSVSVLLGKGNGKFEHHVDYAAGQVPFGVAAGDFRNDNLIDLVLADDGANAAGVLLGNGNGTFQAPTEYATGDTPFQAAPADVNHDGNLDLVTVNDLFNTVSVLLGNGNGTFQPHVDYSTAGGPEWVAIADFNGDGNLDLAVADCPTSYVGYVSILLGNGDGTFQTAVNYQAGECTIGIAAADFNGDGNQDLAVVNETDGTVGIFLGNGDGTFQPQVVYAVGALPFFLVSGDFNGDGVPDLAVANAICYQLPCTRGTVSILLGNGDGTFQPHVDYFAGTVPYGLAEANLSGEGGADVAVANFFSNTVSVLLNLPVVSVFPNAVNFGKEKVGGTTTAQTITIGNPSGTPITIDSIKLTGTDAADFAQTNTCPAPPSTLAPGATCTISATFTPKVTGKLDAQITIKDSVPGSPQLIRLSGKGI